MGHEGLNVGAEEIASRQYDASRKRRGTLGFGASDISDDFTSAGRIGMRKPGVDHGGVNQNGDGEKSDERTQGDGGGRRGGGTCGVGVRPIRRPICVIRIHHHSGRSLRGVPSRRVPYPLTFLLPVEVSAFQVRIATECAKDIDELGTPGH